MPLIVKQKHSRKFGRPQKSSGNNHLPALVSTAAFLTLQKFHYINWFLNAKEDVILSSEHCEGSHKCDMEWDLK